MGLIIWTGIRGYVRIDNGFRAVVWDKIRGTREKIYKSGPHFFPMRAIPPFFKLFLFPEIERPLSEKITVNLPYKNALIHAGDFKIVFRVHLKFKINDKYLTNLSHGQNYTNFRAEIKQTLVDGEKGYFINKLIQKILNPNEEFTKKLMLSELHEFSTTLIKERYGNNVNIVSIDHTLIHFPDIEKYRVHYRIADNFSRVQSENFIKKMIELNYKKREKKTLTEIEIKRLNSYIALMKKGYDILPFLFLEKLSDKIRVVVLPEGKKGIDLKRYFNYLKQNKKQAYNGKKPAKEN